MHIRKEHILIEISINATRGDSEVMRFIHTMIPKSTENNPNWTSRNNISDGNRYPFQLFCRDNELGYVKIHLDYPENQTFDEFDIFAPYSSKNIDIVRKLVDTCNLEFVSANINYNVGEGPRCLCRILDFLHADFREEDILSRRKQDYSGVISLSYHAI